MYVQISSGTKFQLELTILIFWTKFAQKGYFLIEHGKITFVCVPMVVTYYIKLFRTGGERQHHFNVSSPSSRRNIKNYNFLSKFPF